MIGELNRVDVTTIVTDTLQYPGHQRVFNALRKKAGDVGFEGYGFTASDKDVVVGHYIVCHGEDISLLVPCLIDACREVEFDRRYVKLHTTSWDNIVAKPPWFKPSRAMTHIFAVRVILIEVALLRRMFYETAMPFGVDYTFFPLT